MVVKTENALERVAAACPASKYKDDRHEWHGVMFSDDLMDRLEGYTWAMKKCVACRLHVLLLGTSFSRAFAEPPAKADQIITAFYVEKL